MPNWLKDAVFYEIYPQSFYDTNADGIGDLKGITEKLDYVKGLGCNAIWLNPIYDSPFMDAGYDVRDHKKVAARYGNEDDLKALLDKAHSMNMHILLDLVPGHTSDTHPWFQEAKKAKKSEFTNRYIFTNCVWEAPPEYRLMCGICERDGNYLVNYFSSQPALNYGFYEVTHPQWQLPHDHPSAKASAEALKDVMRHWLDFGVDGFRVDMADSLVKNDDEKIATAAIWRDVREMMDKDYPDAALVSEWCNPQRSIKNGGFHMDFYLDHYGNGYSTLFRYLVDGENKSFFCKDGKGDISTFLDEYLVNYERTKDLGYISFMTNNHDMPRGTFYMDDDTIKLSHAMMFTMPGVPFLYYGDELGMRYQTELVSKEGGFSRTGSRTPMQWDSSENLGFSQASADKLYLPVDGNENAPTVENQKNKKGSIYENVTNIIKLRHEIPQLANDSEFELIYGEKNKYPFAYRRGDYAVFVNPSGNDVEISFEEKELERIYTIGNAEFDGKSAKISASSFAIIKTK
ncbi:MAG: glycosylase [Ruminococcus sp.]|nr:glycosylase [Ruminococcus sp.]